MCFNIPLAFSHKKLFNRISRVKGIQLSFTCMKFDLIQQVHMQSQTKSTFSYTLS